MTYKILKYPWKLLLLCCSIVLLPLAIILTIIYDGSFEEKCDKLDEWFSLWLSY